MANAVRVPPQKGTPLPGRRSAGAAQVWRAWRLALLVAALGLLAPSRAGAEGREYEFKAAYVYNFIKFVDWPTQRLPAGSPTINVCVVGKDAYRAALETINGKPVKGRTISVSQYSGPADLARCHILFVGDAESARLGSILESSRTTGVLTVGDTSTFVREGGVIRFRTENNKIRFDINPRAAEEAGLTISSQLLKLARIVQ